MVREVVAIIVIVIAVALAGTRQAPADDGSALADETPEDVTAPHQALDAS